MLKDDDTTPPRRFDDDKHDAAHATAAEKRQHEAAGFDDAGIDEADDERDAGWTDDELTDDDDDASKHRRASVLSRVFDALPASSGLWNALAGTGLVVAAILVLTGHVDAAFVVATLGLLAWFIEKRNRLQAGSREERD